MLRASVLADSVNPAGDRLITFELVYPRFIHAEFLTHRSLSRNSASSRAIPVQKMIQQVEDNPAMPIHWGENQKGMQASKETPYKKAAIALWNQARHEAVKIAKDLAYFGIHKQVVNRLLEPFQFITTIATGNETSWMAFLRLRQHPAAQPEFQELASQISLAMLASEPVPLPWGGWHMPLCHDAQELINVYSLMDTALISAGRCARVSYLTHDGRRDPHADLSLAEMLQQDKHWSPFEHPAQAIGYPSKIRNFQGWRQLRDLLEE